MILRADVVFEDMLAIAEDQEGDFIQLEDGRLIVNHNHIARAKLRIDVRQYMVKVMNPHKFSDKFRDPNNLNGNQAPKIISLGAGINPELNETNTQTGTRRLLSEGPND